MGLIFFIVQDKIYGDLLLQDCVHGLCWRADSGTRNPHVASRRASYGLYLLLKDCYTVAFSFLQYGTVYYVHPTHSLSRSAFRKDEEGQPRKILPAVPVPTVMYCSTVLS